MPEATTTSARKAKLRSQSQPQSAAEVRIQQSGHQKRLMFMAGLAFLAVLATSA
jgi:hypothetical protein